MASGPTIWDYSGLVAAAYDRYFGDEPFWDQAYFEQRIRANGGRALELACGTGRLLLPLAREIFHREHPLRHHAIDELLAFLAQTGFERIEVRGGYTEPPSTDASVDRIFSARRPIH